jgi:hypothetical protein
VPQAIPRAGNARAPARPRAPVDLPELPHARAREDSREARKKAGQLSALRGRAPAMIPTETRIAVRFARRCGEGGSAALCILLSVRDGAPRWFRKETRIGSAAWSDRFG